MTKKNSSRLFVAGILTAAICLAFSVAATSDTHYSIEIIEVNGGYGYQISHNNHITIFQPFIPAISGKKAFHGKRGCQKGREISHETHENRRKLYCYPS